MGPFISLSVIHQGIIHDYCGHDISPVFKKLPWITRRGRECLAGTRHYMIYNGVLRGGKKEGGPLGGGKGEGLRENRKGERERCLRNRDGE